MLRIATLMLPLTLIACGASEDASPRATPGASADPLAHEVRAPSGWKDLSDDPPPALKAAADDTHILENYFLRGTVGRRQYPVAVYIVVERVPRVIGIDAAVSVDRRSIKQLFDDDVRLGAIRKTRVAGEDARVYEQTLRAGDIPGVQRLIAFKRGNYAVYNITLTAPDREQLRAATPGLRQMLSSWRWTG